MAKPQSSTHIDKALLKGPISNVSIDLLEDNHFVKDAAISEQTIEKQAEILSHKGVFPPIFIRKNGMKYEVISGRRRFYVAKRLKRREVPAIVVTISDKDALLLLLSEIKEQNDPNIIELAYVYKLLIEECGYSQNELAAITKQSRSQIANTLRLLKLPKKIIELVSIGELTYGHARALEILEEKKQFLASALIVDEKLSVRDTEDLVKSLQKKTDQIEKQDNEILMDKYSSTFVHINKNNVVFSFENEKERDAFIERLKNNE